MDQPSPNNCLLDNGGSTNQRASGWLNDLTAKVQTTLAHEAKLPTEPVLRRLFEVMYFSSLRTEEAQPISFHIVYLDPDDPDPSPPKRIVHSRWGHIRFQNRFVFDIATVTKIAKASDPRSSSLAVYHDNQGKLFVWGLIDQGNRYYDFVNYNAESGPERPGLFQASIAGTGHLMVYRGYELIADFRIDELRPSPIDALTRGPLYEALLPGILRYLTSIRAKAGEEAYRGGDIWDASLVNHWLTALRRLLLRIQQYRHGGAVLITPDESFTDLNIKYQIGYARLRTCLERQSVSRIRCSEASDEIYSLYLEENADLIPVDLYLDESIAENDLNEAREELDGILWFVSLLSRVDGLILLSPDLEVHGFGVEIQTNAPPAKVVRACDSRASQTKQVTLDYNHFGTRHRSMMRYCSKTAGSVGFVVSQDGDVRARTLVHDTLIVWDNLKLRQDDFKRHRPRKKKRLQKGSSDAENI